ncbi:hypothetical protein [Burkholderia aenigmatica]|uniref:hypothetical protein n=1 Tax=Burkholderia aenigmatica TaxID=2015348 RepID=UPI00264F31A5|nr:hypothetical protein [Burkholderia aenigmatica]MDN7877214.1 hypothetical protein [Burkholderia aenigmatica]
MKLAIDRIARVAGYVVAAACLGGNGSAIFAAPTSKGLPAATEDNWIQAVKRHRTKDGATVAEVLAYAEKMRPRIFKAGRFDVGYNGATGAASSVSIGYWIGSKRAPDDAFVDLGYSMSPDGRVMPVSRDEHTATALENGRKAFLRAVDDAYRDTCLSDPDHPPAC